jgi:hypothetical protein
MEPTTGAITRAKTKRRGKILGANGMYLAAKNREAADEFAAVLRAKLGTGLMGRSYSEVARHLNDAGFTTVSAASYLRLCFARVRGHQGPRVNVLPTLNGLRLAHWFLRD